MGGLVSKIPQLVREKKARDRQDYLNKDIAKAVALSEAMVSRFLRNRVDMGAVNLDTAIRWAKWLGCHAEELVELTEEEN
jgi:transcriptional regulator with XRE-family HTH domain